MSIYQQMDNRDVVHIHNIILLSCKEKQKHELCRVVDVTGKCIKVTEALEVKHCVSSDMECCFDF